MRVGPSWPKRAAFAAILVLASVQSVGWCATGTIHRSAIFPSKHTVDDAFQGVMSVFAAKVDGDGTVDILGASNSDDMIAWWSNSDGSGTNCIKHTVGTGFDGARCVQAADVNGDGYMDVLGAAYGADSIAWWENMAGSGTNWTMHNVTTNFDGVYFVRADDIDGDEDMDLLGAAQLADEIRWWENVGGGGTNWTVHIVAESFVAARCVASADVNGDDHVDIIGAAYTSDDIAWWENMDGSGTNWTTHVVADTFNGASAAVGVDMDSDGDIDILGGAQLADYILWWENMDGSGTNWATHAIETNFNGPRSVCAADLDGDGDQDVVAAAYLADDVAWWENVDGSATNWIEHLLDGDFDYASSVCTGDVDGDGDLDILAAANNAYEIAWWENRGGQFVLAGTNTAPAVLLEGRADDVLKIVMIHLGRPGDPGVELRGIELELTGDAGPLSSVTANGIIENLYVHRDDGSGGFESEMDALVGTVTNLSLVAGKQTVELSDDDMNACVVYGTQGVFFVVVELTDDAAGHGQTRVSLMHHGNWDSAEQWDSDTLLDVEYPRAVGTGETRIVTVRTDSDEDQVPDYWEQDHFGGPTNGLAGSDMDGDEVKNLHEYVLDTDPWTSNSAFCVQAFTNAQDCMLCFESSSNRVYTLEYTEDLVAGDWTPVVGQSNVAGRGGMDWLQDTNTMTTQRFYRVRVSVP